MILLLGVFNYAVTKLNTVDFYISFIDKYIKVFHGYEHDKYIIDAYHIVARAVVRA